MHDGLKHVRQSILERSDDGRSEISCQEYPGERGSDILDAYDEGTIDGIDPGSTYDRLNISITGSDGKDLPSSIDIIDLDGKRALVVKHLGLWPSTGTIEQSTCKKIRKDLDGLLASVEDLQEAADEIAAEAI